MRRTVLAAATLIVHCFSLFCFGQPPQPKQFKDSSEAEVRRFLGNLVNASLKPQAKELEQFYADEYTATNASGAVLDRAAVIAALTSGKLSFKSYEFEEVRVRIYGAMAVVRDSERIESSTAKGRFRHLRVLSKRDGRWQLVAT